MLLLLLLAQLAVSPCEHWCRAGVPRAMPGHRLCRRHFCHTQLARPQDTGNSRRSLRTRHWLGRGIPMYTNVRFIFDVYYILNEKIIEN